MAILEFTGAKTRDAYPELRQQHIDYCLRDVFALCIAAVNGTHEALAETLTAVHNMHRTLCPRISVNFNQLIMALEAGDGNDAEAMVKRSKLSPCVNGELSGDRDLIKYYVLSDTRPVIDLMMEQALNEPNDIAYLQNLVEEKRFEELQGEIAAVVENNYNAPSGNELHVAINEALASANLDAYADKAAPKPPRNTRPTFSLVPPGA